MGAGLAPAQERVENRPALVVAGAGLAVDHEALELPSLQGCGDAGELDRPLAAVPRPKVQALGPLPGHDPEAVVLHAVEPVGAYRRLLGKDRLGRTDEAGRPAAIPSERRTHQHRTVIYPDSSRSAVRRPGAAANGNYLMAGFVVLARAH